jgi:hypothetical protein
MCPEVISFREHLMKSGMAAVLGLTCMLVAGCGTQGPGVEWAAAPAPATKVRIEKSARETVREDFATELSKGAMQWQTVDFWEDKAFAQRYGVSIPTVVIITYANGRQKSFQRLDQLWDLKMDGEKFRACLRDAVTKAVREVNQ